MTCDNAASNNVMVEELYVKLSTFGGAASHTRCFLHVINLLAKSLIHQFDVNKRDADAALAVGELKQLATEDEDGEKGIEAYDNWADVEARPEVDNDDSWVDEVDLLTDKEWAQLMKENLPVRLALVKVC